MLSIGRSSQESKAAARVMISAAVFVYLFGMATWADEHIIEPVNGVYFGEFSADAVLIKYADLCDGGCTWSLDLRDNTVDFYVTAGSFSCWHASDACSLTRDTGVAGGGLTWQGGKK